MPARRGGTRPLAAAAILAGLAHGALAWGAGAGAVVLVRSRSLPEYDLVAAGFRHAYARAVTEIPLEEGAAGQAGQRLEAARPSVVLAIGSRAAQFVRERLPRVPLVFCAVAPAQRADLVGEWVTGVATEVSPGSALHSFKTVLPGLRRIAVFYGRASGREFARAARAAAAREGLELEEVALESLSELAPRARAVIRGVDALWLPPDATVATPEAFQFLLDLSLGTRRPLFAFSEPLARAGALLTVSPDYAAAGAEAAAAVLRIDGGERAGDIPIAAVDHVQLVVNRATARAIGCELPAGLEASAEIVP